ncbi:MAG: ribosome biogenesis GTPase Der [Spirochaetales bacterium]|nr:MAG: ribosome biogenesis GTPase Der [Spirochaetales bacterium]
MGLGEPLPVSSAHGRNMNLLLNVLQKRMELALASRETNSDRTDSEPDNEPDDELVVVLAGRPNAGKSTLANLLTGAEHSLVSEIPGTTRDTVSGQTFYKGRRLRVVDTAGMRRKAKVAENIEYYSVNRAIRAMFDADITVLLIDRKEGLSEQDKKITAQAVKKGRTVVIAINKWDEKNPGPREVKQAVEKLRFQFPVLDWAPVVPVSALKGYGIHRLLEVIIEADRQQNLRVETAELNRALAEWVDFTPPPAKKGRPFRVKYITQVSVKPARFIAFVNRLSGFPESYRRFLVNQIRREFKFEMVPVELELREQAKGRR